MKTLTSIIKDGGIAVVKTDTLYGVVGLAKDKNVVDRIYKVKNRDSSKPVIVLISDVSDLVELGINISDDFKKITKQYWPGKVSIIINVSDSVDLSYLHKGTKGIAFRVPDDKFLKELLSETGPLVAPSANPEGLKPAENIKEAIEYFGDKIDFYDDRGQCTNTKPSKIIKINETNSVEIIRE